MTLKLRTGTRSKVAIGRVRSAANAKAGVLVLKDDKTGEERTLDFVEIHRPLRRIEGGSYFACTDFREHGSKDKFYDIDF